LVRPEAYAQTCPASVPDALRHPFQAGQLIRTEERHTGRMTKQMPQNVSLHSRVGVQPPNRIDKITAHIIFAEWTMFRPNAAAAEEPHLACLADFMLQLGAGNNGNLVAMGPGPKTIFVIDEVHEEVGSWQSDPLYHLAPHDGSRGNHQVREHYRLAKKLGGRLREPIAPKPRNRASFHFLVDRQRGHDSNLHRRLRPHFGFFDHYLQGIPSGDTIL